MFRVADGKVPATPSRTTFSATADVDILFTGVFFSFSSIRHCRAFHWIPMVFVDCKSFTGTLTSLLDKGRVFNDCFTVGLFFFCEGINQRNVGCYLTRLREQFLYKLCSLLHVFMGLSWL